MIQISQVPLKKEIENRVHEIFLDSVTRITDKDHAVDFLDDLLSSTEKTMLAKRLSIAVLLIKGYNQRLISDILKVSVSTVNRVNTKIRIFGKGYTYTVNRILRDEKIKEMLDKIDNFIEDLLPPAGRNWSNWKSQVQRKRRLLRKPF